MIKTILKNKVSKGGILIFFIASSLQAATFNVTTANISGPGSLPVAIAQANATPGDNQINISVSGPITLGLAIPVVTNNVAIAGVAGLPTVISGGGTLPIFSFAAGTTNSISNLVMANGYSSGNGAAICNYGNLYLSNCVVTNNQAVWQNSDQMMNPYFGGAIFNSGSMTINNCAILGNSSGYANSYLNFGYGGAIFNNGTMSLNKSQLFNNKSGNGGAIFNGGSLQIDTIMFSNNSALAGFGGGIFSTGLLSIRTSSFFTNSATGECGYGGGAGSGGGGGGFGGAVYCSSTLVGITNSTFVGNISVGGSVLSGAILGASAYYGKGGGPAGGISTNSLANINGSDGGFGSGGGAGGNSGHGGNGGFGGGGGSGFYGATSVFGGGSGAVLGGAGAGLGGAIFIHSSSCYLVNCTVINNTSFGGSSITYSGVVGGQGVGGGVVNYGGAVKLVNTIIADNKTTNKCPDMWGNFISDGYNLIGSNEGATNLSIFDFQNVSANLGPLQDNGGGTWTCLPLAGSYAIGYGTSIGAPKTDQRGVPRPQNGAIDIGAVQTVAMTPLIINNAFAKGVGYSLDSIFDATNKFRLQGSTNLTTWVDLYTNANGGVLHYNDSKATNLPSRYYRTVKP